MENIDAKFTELEKKIDKLSEANMKIAESLEIIASTLHEVNDKVDDLGGKSEDGFKTVDNRLSEVLEALRKINDVTGYEGMADNLHLVKS